jgi:hypothetical protein
MTDPFDNDWSSVASTPHHRFRTATFDEINRWASSWELSDDIKVVARFTHEDGRIEERSFTSYNEAHKAMEEHSGELIAYDADILFDPNANSVEDGSD